MRKFALGMLLLAPALCWAQMEFDGGGEQLVDVRFTAPQARTEGTFTAVLLIDVAESWHIGWRYPGLIGLPTTLNLKLPEGVELVSQRWSLPHYLGEGGMDEALWAYEGQAGIELKLRLKSGLKNPGDLSADLDYLVCADTCLRGSSSATVALKKSAELTDVAPGLIFERTPSELGQAVSVKDRGKTQQLHLPNMNEAQVEVFSEPGAVTGFKQAPSAHGLLIELIKGPAFAPGADVLIVARPKTGAAVGVSLR